MYRSRKGDGLRKMRHKKETAKWVNKLKSNGNEMNCIEYFMFCRREQLRQNVIKTKNHGRKETENLNLIDFSLVHIDKRILGSFVLEIFKIICCCMIYVCWLTPMFVHVNSFKLN